MLNGQGSSLGPDLNQIGNKRGASYLLETIKKPGSKKILDEKGYILYLVIEVELQNGKTVKGIRLNEDTFTLQLKDSSNKLYSFQKKDLRSIRPLPNESQMPDFSAALSKEEIQNIVAFLSSQK
jgi:putative heme-binding domain-containing protein